MFDFSPKTSRIIPFTIILLFFIASCKKTEVPQQPAPKEQKPYVVEITEAKKLDFNKLSVDIVIVFDSISVFDNYGLAVAQDSIADLSQTGLKIIRFGNLTGVSVQKKNIIVDSLAGATSYWVRAFVRKGAKEYLSKAFKVSTEGLKIVGIADRATFYASREEHLVLKMNFDDATISLKETKIKIDGIDAVINSDYQNYVAFTIPGNLTPGKKTIQIDREGASLIAQDTLEILPGKFTLLPDFPHPYRSLFATGQVGDQGYLFGGAEYEGTVPNGCHNDGLRYNVVSKQWSNGGIASFPKPFIFDCISFTMNNKIYVLPGKDTLWNLAALPSSNRMYEYDISTNTWTVKAALPSYARIRSSGFVLNGKIYVFGGFEKDGATLSDLWEYDPQLNAWNQKTNFPGMPVLYPAIYTYNNKAYIFGGVQTGTVTSSEFWEYNQQTNQWIELALNADIARRYRPTHFTIGDKGYLFGGYYKYFDLSGQTEAYINDAWQLDLVTKQWKRISNYPQNIPHPQYFSQGYYLQSTAFIKAGKAFIYDRGKMIEFSPGD